MRLWAPAGMFGSIVALVIIYYLLGPSTFSFRYADVLGWSTVVVFFFLVREECASLTVLVTNKSALIRPLCPFVEESEWNSSPFYESADPSVLTEVKRWRRRS